MKIQTLLKAAFFAVLLTSNLCAQESYHRQITEYFLNITYQEQLNAYAINALVSSQIQNHPELSPVETPLREFYLQHMGWPTVREQITQTYMQTFTPEEMAQIADFFRTPAGQKLAKAQLTLWNKGREFAHANLTSHQADLASILNQTLKHTPLPHELNLPIDQNQPGYAYNQ